MNEARVYADGFERSFAEVKDLLEFLAERGRNAKWIRKPTNTLRLAPLEKEAQNLDAADASMEEILEDTEKNTQLVLKMRGESYPVRDCAIRTILSRAGVNGDGLRKLDKATYAKVVNYCLRVAKGDALIKIADRMNDAAAQRGKSVRLEAPEGEYYAYTNADRIEQVLVALVDNAIKHGTDGCTVSVNLFENAEKNRYEFVVSNPAEVDPADLEHLFERFYKADHAHTGDGTGLGLAIVSEVLNLLGEKIDIEYENGIIAFRFTAEKCSTPKKHRALQKAENKNEDGEPTA